MVSPRPYRRRGQRWQASVAIWARQLRSHRWFLTWLVVALAVGQLPLLLAACCAPAGRTGLGTVWFINDFAQYESAMRQGAERADWLILDRFTAEPHAPAFMFALYVGLGKLSAVSGVPADWLERATEVVARGLFVAALWRFARAFATGVAAARVAFLLALFGGGLGLPVALLGHALGWGASYEGNASYETNGFGLLFAAPHVPLAMAGTLELATHWLRPVARARPIALLQAAGAAAGVAVLHPFHVPVLVAALAGTGAIWWRTGAGRGTLVACLAISLAAVPVLIGTVVTFTLDPFWSATYSAQNRLPTPAPYELFADLGVTLLLALGGVLALRSHAAPFGLLLWLLAMAVAMYLPVPYQRRLGFGAQPGLAVLAANALLAACAYLRRRPAAALRLGVMAGASAASALVLASVVLSGFTDSPLPVYRSTSDIDAAARWLDTHASAGDVILADWDEANYLAPRTRATVFGGHPVATLRAAEKRALVADVFDRGVDLSRARRLGARWLLWSTSYAPDDVTDASLGPGAFQSGAVHVYGLAEPP